MWIVFGFLALIYIFVNGICNNQRSTVERVAYAWFSIPLVAAYLLIGVIVLIVPFIAIAVFLEDCPVLGVFMLGGAILFVIHAIQCFTKKEKKSSNAFSEKVADIAPTPPEPQKNNTQPRHRAFEANAATERSCNSKSSENSLKTDFTNLKTL